MGASESQESRNNDALSDKQSCTSHTNHGTATAGNSKQESLKYGVPAADNSKQEAQKYGRASAKNSRQEAQKYVMATAGHVKQEAQKHGVATAGNIKKEAEPCDWKAKTGEGPASRHFKESKDTNVPHNFEIILKDADLQVDRSSAEKLLAQLYQGVFLNSKRKKYWVEKQSNKNCFMLFARDLSITWAEDNRFWHWTNLKESTGDAEIDMAELLDVCWLEVHSKFEIAKLSPGAHYEAVLVIMLKDPAYGWDVPVNLRLTLPNGSKHERKENLMVKPRGQWMEIPIGDFKTSKENVGEIEFYVHEYEAGTWKRGLIIKGIAIRPKTPSVSTTIPQ